MDVGGEEGECEVCSGPAEGLEGEEADEGREGGVVYAPAFEETRREHETLPAGEDGLFVFAGTRFVGQLLELSVQTLDGQGPRIEDVPIELRSPIRHAHQHYFGA